MASNLSKAIIEHIGTLENLKTITNCMTRLRLTLHDESLINMEVLKSIDGVLGLIKQGDQYQIILGPGTASTIRAEIEQLWQNNTPIQATQADIKTQMKAKYEVSFVDVLKKISNIFIPLIPAFIASGLLSGVVNILSNPDIAGDFAQQYPNFINILRVFGNSIFFVMMILVGVTSAQVFGGSIAIGASLAGIITHPALASITIFGEKLSAGRGGIISVIIVVALASLLEKKLKNYIKGSLDLILIPLITIFVMGLLTLTILQPLAGYVADFIGSMTTLAINKGGAITGFLLAGAFLPLVMTGLHQALIPIHAQLIVSTGMTVLFPILAMAGAGQVGASVAILIKTKNARIKKVIKTALPVGLLGIGEPLIYGVTLPLGKPFLTACVGGAFGGAVMAFFKVGALSIGISGLPLALSVGQGMIFHYLAGIFSAYIMGFLITYIVGFKDPEF